MNRRGRAIGPGTLRLEKRGNAPARWLLTWTDAHGQRHRQALSTDRRVAERMRSEIIRTRDMQIAGLGTEAGMQHPLNELVELYLGELASRASAKHVLNARARLERVLREVPARRVSELRPLDVMRMRTKMLGEGLSLRTTNLHVDTLRAMLNWAIEADLIAESPLRKLKRLPEREATVRCRRRAMNDEEIDRFLAASEADDRANDQRLAGVKTIDSASKGALWALRRRGLRVPQAPLWRAFVETGARYGELTRTTWADVDLEQQTLVLRADRTKSGKSRVIPLRARLVAELRALRDVHALVLKRIVAPQDRVFLSPEGAPWPMHTVNTMRIFNRVIEQAGIDRVDATGAKLDIHALRHTMASRLARSGVGLAQAQKLLGHSSVEMTARVYTHLDLEDLRRAVAKMGESDAGSARKSAM